jgi:hypothetical protein
MSELLNNFYDQNKCKYTKFYEIYNSKIIERFSIDEQEIDEQEIDEQGINEQEINEQGINKQGINKQEINEQGINKQEINEQGINEQVINEQIIDEQGINEQGINEQGINEQGINEQGINEQGINEQGINEQGINEQEINEQVINEQIIDEQIIDEQGIYEHGIDEQGIDEQIIDEQGINEQGINKAVNYKPIIDNYNGLPESKAYKYIDQSILTIELNEKREEIARKLCENKIQERDRIAEDNAEIFRRDKNELYERVDKAEKAAIEAEKIAIENTEKSEEVLKSILKVLNKNINISPLLLSSIFITKKSKVTVEEFSTSIIQINELLNKNQSITPYLFNTLLLGLENIIILSYKDFFMMYNVISEPIVSTVMIQFLQAISYIVTNKYNNLYIKLLKFFNIKKSNNNYKFMNLEKLMINAILLNTNDYTNSDNISNASLLLLLSNIIYNNQPIPYLLFYILFTSSNNLLTIISDNESIDIDPIEEKINELMISNKLFPIFLIKQIIKIFIENIKSDYTDIKSQLNKLLITNPLRGEILILQYPIITEIITSLSLANLIIPSHSIINVTEFSSTLDKLKILLTKDQLINPEIYNILLGGLSNLFQFDLEETSEILSTKEQVSSFILIQLLHSLLCLFEINNNNFKIFNKILKFLNINIPNIDNKFVTFINLIKKTFSDNNLSYDGYDLIDINTEYSILQILSVILNNNQPIPQLLLLILMNSPFTSQISRLQYENIQDSDNVDLSEICSSETQRILNEKLQKSMKENKLIPILDIKKYFKCMFTNINSKYSEIKIQIDKLLFNNPNVEYAKIILPISSTLPPTPISSSSSTLKSSKKFFKLPVILGISSIVLIIFILVVLKIMNII